MNVLFLECSKVTSRGSLNFRYNLSFSIYTRNREECSEGLKWISAEERSPQLFLPETGGRTTLPVSLVGMMRICPDMSLSTGCA